MSETTMSQQYLAALLAKASYQTFSSWEPGSVVSGGALIEEPTRSGQGSFTDAEAQYFAEHFF